MKYVLEYIHISPDEIHVTNDETTIPHEHCLAVKFRRDFDGDDQRQIRNKRLEMRDWLFTEYGLNRGYRCIDRSDTLSLAWFENMHDVLKFKLVFG